MNQEVLKFMEAPSRMQKIFVLILKARDLKITPRGNNASSLEWNCFRDHQLSTLAKTLNLNITWDSDVRNYNSDMNSYVLKNFTNEASHKSTKASRVLFSDR